MNPSPIIAFFDCNTADRHFYRSKLKPDQEFYMSNASIQNDDKVDLSAVQILSVHVTSTVTAEFIKKMPSLQLITARSTGFDNIDLAAAKKHNITVCNVPGYGASSVAEYSFMLMLALSRKLIMATQQLKTGEIDHTLLTGNDLAGKTLGVIGTGSIGRHVIRIANGFGMKVLAYDPFPDRSLEYETNMEYVLTEQLYKESDIITLHAPYTKDNHHLINSKAFASMKAGAYIINTSRGELIDTQALVAVLASGKLGGAAIDVFEGENIFQITEEIELLSHPLSRSYDYAVEDLILEKMPNVIMTPHNAFNSKEALGLIQQVTVDNIAKFLAHTPQNVVSEHR